MKKISNPNIIKIRLIKLIYYCPFIELIIKFKNNKAKDFKIDLDSLALAYQDNRLSELELGGWGLHHNWPI